MTVLAILGIIFGSLILLGTLCNSLQFAGVSLDPNNPIVKGMQDDRVLFGWSIVGVVVNLVLGALLLAGSIGSLSLKRFGRSCMVAYSWLDIAFTVISAGITVAMVMPRLDQILQNSNLNPAVRSITQISMWGGFAFSLLLLVFPGSLLYYMSRPHVKEAFQRGMAAPAQQWGGGSPPPDGAYPPPPGGAGTY